VLKASGSTAGVVIITRECSLETLKALFPTGEVEYLIAPFPQQALAVAANRALNRGDLARRDCAAPNRESSTGSTGRSCGRWPSTASRPSSETSGCEPRSNLGQARLVQKVGQVSMGTF
jgi:DNA-binding NtrC family response regulator